MPKTSQKLLNPKQMLAISMLVDPGVSYQDVSKRLGISCRTLYQWRRLPHFKEALDEVLGEVREKTMERLNILNEKVICEIEGVLTTPFSSRSQVLKASMKIMDYKTALLSEVTLQNRVTSLELRVNELTRIIRTLLDILGEHLNE